MLLLALGTVAFAAEEKYERVDTEHLVQPIAASYVGSAGTEWLTGGGFQPDGSLVLVGVTLGPTFDPGGVTVKVLGPDQPAPEAQGWPMMFDARGKPRLNKEGEQRRDKFKHSNPAATAFVVRLTPDFKSIVSASRFPWTTGTVTGAVVDAEGGIYLVGYGKRELLQTLCDDVREIDAPKVDYGKQPPSERTNYLARLSSDGTKVQWLRHITAPQDFPRVELLRSGNVLFKGLAFDTFDRSGNRIARLTCDKGFNARHYDVNEQTGEFVYGHEHHWPTGREPWRCPELKIYHPDGSVKYHLYNWPGPVVGSDSARLVSDSAIRNIQYMPDGQILFSAWSDGGNSVMYGQPFNFHRKAWNGRTEGLRLSAAGAGAMSFAYVIKIDPDTCKVNHGTLWVSQYKGVESARIEAMTSTADGSVAIAGSVFGDLYTTPNHFNEGAERQSGNNLTILNPHLDGLRFSSIMPGCGEIDLGNDARFRWFRGVVNGREMLVAVTGATDEERTPCVNPTQPRFAGGQLDGHFTVFDMTGAPIRQ
ncbi:MAG: hypothetical protein GC159_03255 [Phycisphaera sp.]|nr:hypothetical protein [Phycisphaera sp.]